MKPEVLFILHAMLRSPHARKLSMRCDSISLAARLTHRSKSSTRQPSGVIVKRQDLNHIAYGRGSDLAAESRRILRQILRECTYLPDPNARSYLAQFVSSRFRQVSFKIWQTRDQAGTGVAVDRQLRKARQMRNGLQRANEGDRQALLRCLEWTYGRRGKRRHVLLQPLMPAEGRQDIIQLMSKDHGAEQNNDIGSDEESFDLGQEHIEASHGEERTGGTNTEHPLEPDVSTIGKPLPSLTPELYALAASQQSLNLPSSKKAPKHLQPVIPEFNARLLPMPKKRVKNLTHQWYAKVLDRILAPLPIGEWEQLRGWALGMDMPDVKEGRRRSEASSSRGHFGGHTALQAIVVKGQLDPKYFPNKNAHRITPRFMQRVWAQIFSECPVMDWDDTEKKWSVRWGKQELQSSRRHARLTVHKAESHSKTSLPDAPDDVGC
ncbi:hypothetical protein AC579_4749 [Pseudocercospora musae]|uniref:LYR motif-containing protein Cup1-like N-terminal domain-containing protein n=1 Tax=Pseudocercospora musae TaxID=113226 RepID=A0A139IQB4_9PEZI|nr:hypothetical protein AC579_4749 [Pseudocercospora musae]KXT16876.1 hypothetical protein AC579_4749 [Pseudocercospora musae]